MEQNQVVEVPYLLRSTGERGYYKRISAARPVPTVRTEATEVEGTSSSATD